MMILCLWLLLLVSVAQGLASPSSNRVTKYYDLVVIGGGSAGLTAAKLASTFEKSSVIIEANKMGGDCTWTGCIPSKSLLASSKMAHSLLQPQVAASLGIRVPSASSSSKTVVDWPAVQKSIQEKIQRIHDEDDSPEAMAKLGIDTILGHRAIFQNPQTLYIGDDLAIVAKEGIVVATGATARQPTQDIEGLDTVPYLTYEDIFTNLSQLPNTMTIVGGGPIGCELAQAFARLGVKVTLVAEKLLPTEEPEISFELEKVFESEGIVRVKDVVTKASNEGDGHVVTTQKGTIIKGNALLVAVGRVPNTKGFGLEQLGVEFNERGGIQTNAKLKSSVKSIYAAGDCTGDLQFTHYAGFQGAIAARNILLPLSDGGVLSEVPSATFTSPEISSIGLTQAQAEEEYGAAKVAVAMEPLSHVADRSVCDGQDTFGLIKIVYHAKSYQILGASIMSPSAGELISELAVAIKAKMPFDKLATVIHAYPAYSIALQIMAGKVYYEKTKKSKPLLDFLKRLGL